MNKSSIRNRAPRPTAAILSAACAAVLGAAGTASAIDKNFNVAEGDYTNDANWVDDATGQPTSAPTSSDNAFIGVLIPGSPPVSTDPADPGVATGTALVGPNQVANANFLTLGRDVDTTGGLRITGDETGSGTVQPRFDFYVGGQLGGSTRNNGTGQVDQLAGSVTASNLFVGMGRNGEGVYNISGGTINLNNISTSGGNPVNAGLYIGSRQATVQQLTDAGGRILDAAVDAAVNQSGGDVLVEDLDAATGPTSIVQLGRTPGSANQGRAAGDNLYTLSGGRLSTPNLQFGNVVQNVTGSNAGSNTFTLSGTGVLSATNVTFLNTGAANAFNFNGGTLTANTVNLAQAGGGTATLANNGGNLSPGRGGPDFVGGLSDNDFNGGLLVGTTAITGGYSQSAAGRTTLDIGSGGHDRVEVGGPAALAGNLTVRSEEGFTPPSAVDNLAQYQVMTFASRSGRFTTYSGRDVNADLTYVPVYSETDLKLVATVPGDATLDGRVNLADFGRLRSGFGQASAAGDFTQGDFDLSGAVNLADFGILRAHFNDTVNSGGAFGPAAISEADWAVLAAFEASVVPEPTAAAALLALAAPALLARRRRRGA